MGNPNLIKQTNSESCCCCDSEPTLPINDGHDHGHHHAGNYTIYLSATISFILLIIGIGFDYGIKPDFFKGYIRLFWYIIAYLPVGLPVMKEAWDAFLRKDFFTEFSLMCLATIGAFAIQQYPEGVAVMLFYAIGELFQSAAVKKAKGNIKALLDFRPATATVFRENKYQTVKPETVNIDETIQIKAGEKVPLDGVMLHEGNFFNTSALTGESTPNFIKKGESVLAGMLNLDKVIELKVSKKFADSSLSKILDLVQNAVTKKAKTELLIRKFARVYTPIVFFLAVALVIIPYFFVSDYEFKDWLYRALIFLVISCPCALVISIPLGFFGGIGAGSRNGILFKGSNFLELITKVNTVVFDKTGTLTEGVFKVQKIETVAGIETDEFLKTLAILESQSNHPISKAIVEYAQLETHDAIISGMEEIPGFGLKGIINGKQVIAGNTKLFKKLQISYATEIDKITESIVMVAIEKQYSGFVLIADEIKDKASKTIQDLRKNGIKKIIMLSGDKTCITEKVAQELQLDEAYGDLLPEQKVEHLEHLKKDPEKVVAFVGDGINDAPVLALSDIGIAMGAIGSDLAIETADVVIQTDHPHKIVTAIKIGKATRKIVIQNISLAFGVKIIVLLLGAGGIATMWEAVFADVGVALLAILNAVRIQRMDFE